MNCGKAVDPLLSSLYNKFVSKIVDVLSQFNNIFTEEVKSKFNTTDEMFSFVRELLYRFLNIVRINSYEVNFILIVK